MLKELLNKKIDLYKTFYGYGLFGLFIARLVVWVFNFWNTSALKGMSIINYYKYKFTPIGADMNAVFSTLFYLASIYGFVYYAIIVFKLVWKSCADFEKSLFLEFMARVLIVIWALSLAWSIL
ncbi:MAG: hypothetical protein R3Y43_01080 [Alphaproteobacteria bacterium]